MLTLLNQIIAEQYKKKILFILFIIFFQAMIETVSIAAILPFLAVVGSPELVQTNKILSTLYAWAPVSSTREFMLFLGGVFFFIIAFGNIFASFASWYFLRFSMFCGHQLSSDLFNKYLAQPYPFFIKHNSSFLISNIIAEVSRVILGVLINLLQMFNKSIMVLFILSLLVYIDWKLACGVMAVLGSTYLIAFMIIKQRLKKAGQLSSNCNTHRYKAVQEAFAVIKELKLLGRESYFHNLYNQYSLMYANNETNSQVLPQISRYLIEIIAFGGILLIVMYLLFMQSNVAKVLPLLGVYALSGYRLMPALQQIFSCVSTIRYHANALDQIALEFKRKGFLQTNIITPLTFYDAIQLNNVNFKYEGAKNFALYNFNLHISARTSIGIVGASGAGKTTLVDILLGLYSPQSGTVSVDNVLLSEENLQAWRANIGYVPQTIRLIDDSIRKNIALGVEAKNIDENQLIQACKMAGISDFIESLPEQYETWVGEEGARLSGGQKQRIGIARALYHNPQVLVLDEATSALDSFSEKIIVETLKKLSKEKTIILIAHRLSTVKHCDDILVMKDGVLMDQGDFDELYQRSEHFNAMVNGLNN